MKRFLVFLVAVAAMLVSTAISYAQPMPLNGFIGARDQLVWSNGGGDPLQSHLRADGFREALALPGLNLSTGLQAEIRRTVLEAPDERIDMRMYQGSTLQGVMVSGNGWLAVNPEVRTSSWTRQNFAASVWFVTYTNSAGVTERWMVIAVDVCGNLILVPLNVALPCVCVPGQDVCAV